MSSDATPTQATIVNPKNFRVQYKTIGLTYSQFAPDKHEFLKWLQDKCPTLDEYYIVHETHKDGNKHMHAWFSLSKAPNIRNVRFFDYGGIHPNIGNKKKNWIRNYLMKEDKDPLTNVESSIIAVAERGDYEEALSMYKMRHPNEYIRFKGQIEANLRAMGRKEKPVKTKPLESFKQEALLALAVADTGDHSIWLQGKPGIGKTQFVKSYVVHHKKARFLWVTHMDQLRKYDGQEYIIFDDMSFTHTPRQNQIALVDVEEERAIHCRFAPAVIPEGVVRIFTSNDTIFGDGMVSTVDEAVWRRIKYIKWGERLW